MFSFYGLNVISALFFKSLISNISLWLFCFFLRTIKSQCWWSRHSDCRPLYSPPPSMRQFFSHVPNWHPPTTTYPPHHYYYYYYSCCDVWVVARSSLYSWLRLYNCSVRRVHRLVFASRLISMSYHLSIPPHHMLSIIVQIPPVQLVMPIHTCCAATQWWVRRTTSANIKKTNQCNTHYLWINMSQAFFR